MAVMVAKNCPTCKQDFEVKLSVASVRRCCSVKCQGLWKRSQRSTASCLTCNKLHADHKKRWADNEQLRYNVDNGRTLCVPCHYYITFKRKMKPGTRWCNFIARKEG